MVSEINKHLLLSSIVLIVVNLIPVFGVLFWGWNAYAILLAYWIESFIVGVFAFIKIRKSTGKDKTNVVINGVNSTSMAPKKLSISFLNVYGSFMFVHLIFLSVFYSLFFKSGSILFGTVISSISLFLSHWMSYRINFIGKEEYKQLSPSHEFNLPFKRIFVMQFIIILGIGFFVGVFHAEPQMVILPTALFKVTFDLLFHIKEHSKNPIALVIKNG